MGYLSSTGKRPSEVISPRCVFLIWGIIFLIEVLETPDISIYRVRKIYLLQKLFLPRKCLTVDISPVRLETLNTKMTIYSLSNGLSFDKCGFVKKNCRQKKNNG